tara:strand:+ start:7729 stop:8469 length:741 start_codon:yes stop_codon:yes gene_type:complete
MQINSKKTAFVIGTGPSLNTIDVKKLSDYDCVTFNRAYIAFDDWGFVPRYYLSIDGNDLRSIYKDINLLVKKHKNTDFFVVDDPANEYFPEDSFQDCEKKYNLFDYNQPNLHNFEYFYSRPIQGNAGYMGVKLLEALGYRNIGFVGCDCHYLDDDEYNKDITIRGNEYISHADTDMNHFRKDYFGKGMHFGCPNPDEILAIWEEGLKKDRACNLNVFSCTPNSPLNKFCNYIDFEYFIRKDKLTTL